MAKKIKQAIVDRVHEKTRDDELVWTGELGVYQAEISNLMVQLIRDEPDGEPTLFFNEEVEIKANEVEPPNLLSEIELLVKEKIAGVTHEPVSGADTEEELRWILNQLGTKA